MQMAEAIATLLHTWLVQWWDSTTARITKVLPHNQFCTSRVNFEIKDHKVTFFVCCEKKFRKKETLPVAIDHNSPVCVCCQLVELRGESCCPRKKKKKIEFPERKKLDKQGIEYGFQ